MNSLFLTKIKLSNFKCPYLATSDLKIYFLRQGVPSNYRWVKWSQDWNDISAKTNRPLLRWFLSGSRGRKRRGNRSRVFWALESRLKLTRRGRKLQKGHFSLPGPILPSRSIWQLWASETLQKGLSNASETRQKRSTSRLHLLLDVFIYCRSFMASKWARRCWALLARVWVCPAAFVRDR